MTDLGGKRYFSLAEADNSADFDRKIEKIVGTSDVMAVQGAGYTFAFTPDNKMHLVHRDLPYTPLEKLEPDRSRVAGRKLTSEEQDEVARVWENVNPPEWWRRSRDPHLTAILEKQGFDGLPDVISKKEMDERVAAGELEMYRGMGRTRAWEHEDTFVNGEFFVGTGMYGNGVYTVYGSGAKQAAQSYGDHPMRMTLKPGSKVITYDEALVLKNRLQSEVKVDIFRDPNWRQQQSLGDLYGDVGRVAALEGYDAVDVVGQKYLVLLNRTAVRVER